MTSPVLVVVSNLAGTVPYSSSMSTFGMRLNNQQLGF